MKKLFCIFFIAIVCFAECVSAQPYIIINVVGTGISGYNGDNIPATNAKVLSNKLAFDHVGNMYIADGGSRIRKVNPLGIISTIAGIGVTGHSGDSGPATIAMLNTPFDVVVDLFGNLLIADGFYIRKVNTSGVISTIAGDGNPGFWGDGGMADTAEFDYPNGITVDVLNNIFIADADNGRIRKINTAGIINTIAGNGLSTFNGDGGMADTAHFNSPSSVITDNSGNYFVADMYHHRIRKVDATGIISTVAGNGIPSFGGDGGMATAACLKFPIDVKLDNAGNIYIVDGNNSRIRKVDHITHFITTIAGNGTFGYNGTGILATNASLISPYGVAIDDSGSIYIADYSYVRKLVKDYPPVFIHGSMAHYNICSQDTITLDTTLVAIDSDLGQTDTWSIAVPPTHGIATGFYTHTTTSTAITPNGFRYVANAGYTGQDTIKIIVADNIGGVDTMKFVFTVTSVPPAGSITGAFTLCVGDTLPLIVYAIGGVWSASNTHAIVTSTGVVIGISTGGVTISYTVSNGCGSASATHIIGVNPKPIIEILGMPQVCLGNTVTFTDSVITAGIGLSSGLWQSATGNTTLTGSGLITGTAVGIDTISCIITNSCGADTAKYVLAVITLPNPGIITGYDSVCIGTSIILTDTITGGLWSTSFAKVSITGGVTLGVSEGLDTVLFTLSNMCGDSAAKKAIWVNPLPNAGIITGMDSVCVGNNTTLYDTAIGGNWYSSNVNATITSNILSGVFVGLDTIYYKVNNTCGNDSVLKVISILSTISSTISGSNYVCLNRNLDTISYSPSGGSWQATNTNASVTDGIVTPLVEGIDTIIYSITNFCGTTYDSLTITIPSKDTCDAINKVSYVNSKVTGISIYPNPNTGIFTIEIQQAKKVAISITDMQGQIIFNKSYENQFDEKILTNLDNIARGIYFSTITTDEIIHRDKIVVW